MSSARLAQEADGARRGCVIDYIAALAPYLKLSASLTGPLTNV